MSASQAVKSLTEFRARVRPAVEAKMVEGAKTGKPPILVVHSSVVHEIGMMINDDHQSALVEPGGAIVVLADEKGSSLRKYFCGLIWGRRVA